MIASKERRRISPRSRGAVAAHSACASTAASSAAIASEVSPSATSVITDSSAGSCTSNLLPEPDSRHCPPMKRPREPVFAKRSSPVMESACHWAKFDESVHAAVRTLTLCGHRPGGMHPDDESPSQTPCREGLTPHSGRARVRAVDISRGQGLCSCLPSSRRDPATTAPPSRRTTGVASDLRAPPLELAAGQELFGLHHLLA